VGKLAIPGHILRSGDRTQVEENVYRDHCRAGVEIARESGAFSDVVLSVIRDHHEHLDGSGFPAQAKADAIGMPARIVAVVNRYDRLCGPESPTRKGMRPADALKKMWREERARLDERVIAALVRVLGVYPPGTLVELSDGRCGLAVNPSSRPLLPRVVVYEPSRLKDDADLLDLSEQTPQLAVSRALAPDDVAPEVLEWLNPRERLAYYFTADENA
jgi:HD-GYP domain-containing protein (c-di-GMP phosphodiesterase class II)